MHRLLPMAVLAASLLLAGNTASAAASDRDEIARLEDAVAEAAATDRLARIETLKKAYESAARKAEAAGQTRQARAYRENLQLLSRNKPTAKPEPATPKPEPIEPKTPEPGEPKKRVELPLADDKPQVAASPALKPHAEPEPEPEPDASVLDAMPGPEPLAPETATPEPSAAANHVEPKPERRETGSDLARGDQAWRQKRYLEAGAIYAELARSKKLPPERGDYWAYCRLVRVLEVINAGPTTPKQWESVQAEIDRIQVLSPKNWYAEYLRRVATERQGLTTRKPSGRTILRGASPDETPAPAPEPKAAPTRSRKQAAPGAIRPAAPAPTSAIDPAPATEAEVGRPGPNWGTWQTFDTPNFRIIHADEPLARKVAARAEAARADLVGRWSGATPRGPWTPRCDVFLYPTSAQFSQETGQPEESPGFSTAELNGGRVSLRLVKLRADHPRMVEAVLPHEVTHVVLAELFPVRQIPRWADEGMAVLSEPTSEQTLRAADLHGPLAAGGVFKLSDLMTTDYPAEPYRALFYAQSISVTRFLVAQGTPTQFVGFVSESQSLGIEPALKKHYQINGYADLDTRWRKFAQANLAETAANPTTPTRR